MTALQSPLVVVGLDLSMASTGVARAEVDDQGAPTWRTWQVSSPARGQDLASQHARLADSAERVWRAVMEAGAEPDLVMVESPAMGHQASRAGTLALTGHWWLTLDPFLRAGIPVATLSPSSLKVYATGHGGSPGKPVTKQIMRAAIEPRYPGLLTGGVHDVAEAGALAAAAARLLGRPIDCLPDTHVRALDKAKAPITLSGKV